MKEAAGGRNGRSRGQTVVELALVLPLFLVIVIGIFDFGRAIYVSNAISNAARVANRVAIVDQDELTVQQAAVDEAAAVGLEPADVVVSYSCTDKIELCFATVEISKGYTPATPLIEAMVGPITLSASSEMPLERTHDSSP